MVKTFPSNKKNFTKNSLFFLLPAPTPHSFTFNSSFVYGLKLEVYLCRMFHFQSRFVFINVYIFIEQKGWTL